MLNTYKVLELLGSFNEFEDFGKFEDKRYIEIANCGTFLQFSPANINGEKFLRLTAANFCRQRICPMCQYRRAEKLFSQTLCIVKNLEEEGYRFLHMVLTIPNCETALQLENSLHLLYKGFSLLWKYKVIRKAFKGALRCLEVSYNYDNNTFHPHLHCLIAVKKSYFNDAKVYISLNKMREMWTESIQKASKSLDCDLSFLPSDLPLLQVHLGAVKEGDYKGVAEVCKYCIKPLDFDKKGTDEQNARILYTLQRHLKSARLLQKYGVIREAFRGFDIDELLDTSETPGEDFKFFWDSGVQAYRRCND
jgi:hypothetical protein